MSDTVDRSSMADPNPRTKLDAAAPQPARRNAAIFRTVYPLPSETFITEQARALAVFEPRMVVRDSLSVPAGLSSPVVPRGKIARALWTLTRIPQCFPLGEMSAFELIHAHFGQDAVMVLPIARRLDIPLLATFHGADVTVDTAALNRRRRPTERHFERAESELRRHGAGFIAVSDFIAQRLARRGYSPDRIHQIYIGVDLQKFSPDPQRKDGAGRYILCVGRHTPKKGIDKLVAAWARIQSRHPDVTLKQVGSGDETANLKRLAEKLGVADRVEWLGARPHRDVLGLMQGAEIFALPSETASNGDSEALGIVFNEASACEVPIVSTRHGGIPEAVVHGETGLLASEGDIDELARNLDALLCDRELGRSMGKRGRARVESIFDIRAQTRKLESLYSAVIDHHCQIKTQARRAS